MLQGRTIFLFIFLMLLAAPAVAATTQPDQPQDLAAARQRIDELQTQLQEYRAKDDDAGIPPLWLAIGFVGQTIFGMRFVVQWIATERQKKSVVPVAFWHLSLAGSVIMLAYAIYRVDPVIIAGFSLNMIIYVRNLYHIKAERLAKLSAPADDDETLGETHLPGADAE